MKKIKVLMSVLSTLACIIGVICTILSIWANKPRGIRIDLDTIKN